MGVIGEMNERSEDSNGNEQGNERAVVGLQMGMNRETEG